MRSFASPKAFADIIVMMQFAILTGKNAEELLQELLPETLQVTSSQAKQLAGVMATLVTRKTDSPEFDPLAPAKVIGGRWRSNKAGKTASGVALVQDTFEFRDDLTFISLSGSGAKTAGLYVAGFSNDGYAVALCFFDGSVREMRVVREGNTARVGDISLTKLVKVQTAHPTLLGAATYGDLADMAKHIRNGENLNQLYEMESVGGAKGEYASVLHLLVYKAPAGAVETLLTAGADPNVKDSKGEPPLYSALAGGQAVAVELLLKHGAEVNARFRRGNTALHITLLNDQEQLAHILLKYGADRHAKNDDGVSPAQIARLRGLKDAV